MSSNHPIPDADTVLAATRNWIEKAVIGLNLCPFAKAVYVRQQVRYRVCEATAPEALLAALIEELQHLAAANPAQVDTTVLVHPRVLDGFLDFNDFLQLGNEVLADLELEGELQIASFHPRYQFAGTEPDAMENFTNRSPYPILHLLRESSIDRAVEAFPQAERIYEKNIATLESLGPEGWRRLFPE